MEVEDIEDVAEEGAAEQPASEPEPSPVSESPPSYNLTALIGSLFSNMTQPDAAFIPGGYPDDLFTDLTPEEKQEHQCGIW